MKIFISGASGLLGGNSLKHFKARGHEVVGTHLSYATEDTVYFNTLDKAHPDNFDLLGFKPDVIVHCGALTHVDYCETNIEESYEKTVQSTINLVDWAKQCEAKLVYISTDYVFDGTDGPYTETAPLNPLSVYGKHKLEAEQLAVQQLPDTLVLRITNVYGDELRGKNFIARIIQQCEAAQHLTLKLPYDQFASPTNAWDVARAMLVLLEDDKSGIYHIGSSDYMNRVELALRVLSYYPSASYDLIPTDTVSMQQPAARPLLGGFVKAKFAAEYPDFLFGTVDSYVASKVNSKQ